MDQNCCDTSGGVGMRGLGEIHMQSFDEILPLLTEEMR